MSGRVRGGAAAGHFGSGLDAPTRERLKDGFDRAAARYAAGRPGYPQAAVEWLVDDRPTRVLDLAAGSGSLTRLLVPRVASVFAAEPSRNLLMEVRTSAPSARRVRSVAESLPFRDGVFDLVTVATAFHWFDADPALAEIARVLRPGGRVCLLWNTRATTSPFAVALDRLLRSAQPSGMGGDWGTASAGTLSHAPGFGRTESAAFPHRQLLDMDTLIGLVGSRSYVIDLDEADRLAVLDETRSLFETHQNRGGLVTIPYLTECWRASRLP